jgi:L-erythro-3,5-diaminohexanoate dehydrogenase
LVDIPLEAEYNRQTPATLSIWRAIEPPGALPHIASKLDATSDPTEHEAAIDVELLRVDATSFAELRARCGGDPPRIARLIAEIVDERGKLQNPWTGSGGVLLGKLLSAGPRYRMPELRPGTRVMPIASLIAVPLRLDDVGPVDPRTPLVPVRGRAIVTGRMLCVTAPDDFPPSVALAIFDVYPAASHVRAVAKPGSHVLVLGAGHAGLLAVAAAREAVGPGGQVTAVDRSPTALRSAVTVDPKSSVLECDVTKPAEVLTAMTKRRIAPAHLTVLCTTVEGAEGAAVVSTADGGTVLFFSTATNFAAAALGADALGSRTRLEIPNGLTEDRGEYAFDLVRRLPALRRMFNDGRS